MSISIVPIGKNFAGEVSGVDLRGPLSPDIVAAIDSGMDEFAVLVFRDQDITDNQQLEFSQNFGPVESSIGGNISSLHSTRPDQRRLSVDMADVSNLDQDQNIYAREDRRRLFNLGNRLWHSDSSFRAVPAKYSLLSARSIPADGPNTEYADMRAAYDALDVKIKEEVEGLICEHSLMYSRGQLGFTEFTEEEQQTFAPVRQVLVRTHPVTMRKSLFLASHAGTIVGWPMAEARMFLRDLIEHATQPQFVYVHRWRSHDLVVWDNRQTMHRVRRFNETEYVRDVRRTTISSDGPTTTQVAN